MRQFLANNTRTILVLGWCLAVTSMIFIVVNEVRVRAEMARRDAEYSKNEARLERDITDLKTALATASQTLYLKEANEKDRNATEKINAESMSKLIHAVTRPPRVKYRSRKPPCGFTTIERIERLSGYDLVTRDIVPRKCKQ